MSLWVLEALFMIFFTLYRKNESLLDHENNGGYPKFYFTMFSRPIIAMHDFIVVGVGGLGFFLL